MPQSRLGLTTHTTYRHHSQHHWILRQYFTESQFTRSVKSQFFPSKHHKSEFPLIKAEKSLAASYVSNEEMKFVSLVIDEPFTKLGLKRKKKNVLTGFENLWHKQVVRYRDVRSSADEVLGQLVLASKSVRIGYRVITITSITIIQLRRERVIFFSQ